MLPRETVEGLLELSEKATDGPWYAAFNEINTKGEDESCVGYPSDPRAVASLYDGEYIENINAKLDANLIAAMRNNIEQLCRDNLRMHTAVYGAIDYLENGIDDMALEKLRKTLADDAEEAME